MNFEIKNRDAAGRICKLYTNHGTVTTPTLMPVINPNKMTITPKEMIKLFGTQIVITNSYIINKNDSLRKESLAKGVHKLLDFKGPIMTDSGTFQSYVYGDIHVDPISIVQFQRDIGSDIGTILDIFSTPDQTKKEALAGIQETIKRARESISHKAEMSLACTVQGSIYPDLRKKCAEELSCLEADVFPIGGVVPLMEGQRYSDLIRVILASKQGLDPSKPVHLFGCGHPLLFPLAVALGCDFFDSSAYIKYATDKRLLFPWGTEHLDQLEELPCSCPICTKYSASELQNMEHEKTIVQIAKHNLYVSFSELKRIREAIKAGCLWELVERKATANPFLYEALYELHKKEHKQWLMKFEPRTKRKALFYTGPHTIHRPFIHRTNKYLQQRYHFISKNIIALPEGKKPYFTHYKNLVNKISLKYHVHIIVDSPLGPVPLELDEMYPYAQSVFPSVLDEQTSEQATAFFTAFLGKKKIVKWKDAKSLLRMETDDRPSKDFDELRIRAVADIQFGRGASQALFNGKVMIQKSKKTGKIRTVFVDNNHILSLRAEDGFFTLKKDGGKRLHSFFRFPQMRIIVQKEAVESIKDGKSVFAKFVADCDPKLVPYDECLIVDEEDTLLAVGRCLLNREEMLSFNYGMAVKIRDSIDT